MANPHDIDRVVDELERHQAELELENQELRLAQRLLEESRAHYAQLFELAPVGYFTLDDQGTIIEVNRAASSILGVARDALRGRALASLFAGDEAASAKSLFRRCLDGKGRRATVSLQRGEGGRELLEIILSPAFDTTGAMVGARAVIVDADRTKSEGE